MRATEADCNGYCTLKDIYVLAHIGLHREMPGGTSGWVKLLKTGFVFTWRRG